MLLKTIIVLLFIGNIVALAIAFSAMMKKSDDETKNTAKWLMVRVSLAALLLATVTFGVVTGELGISSPWHNPQP